MEFRIRGLKRACIFSSDSLAIIGDNEVAYMIVQSYWEFLKCMANNTDYEALKKKIDGRSVYIRGADEKGYYYKDILEKNGIHVKGFIDQYIKGEKVYRPSEIIFIGNSRKAYIFISMQFAHKNELENELNEADFKDIDYYWPYKEWSFLNKKIGSRTDCSHQEIYYKGARQYFKLYEEKLYLLVYGGHSGDAGMVMSWLYAFKEKHFVKKISVITTDIFESICRLYSSETDEIIVLSGNDIRSLDYFVRDITTRVYNVFGSEWEWSDKSMKIPFDMNHILYKTCTLGISADAQSEYFCTNVLDEFTKQRLSDAGVIFGKSIIFIPYARSSKNLPKSLWEKMAKKLEGMFSVFTNCSLEETPIAGTKSLHIPIGDIPYAVKYAGAAVCIRCGIADILALGQCDETIVLYYVPNESEMNYAKVNCRYINGEDSILYNNAIFVEQSFDEEKLVDDLVERVKVNMDLRNNHE